MNPSSSILYPTEVESLRQQLVERDAELRRINHAINDPRVDLTITATEAITDLRYKLGVVSSLLREASGRSSYGNWSTEFRTNVEKALAASDVDIERLKGMVDEIHAARKVVNQHDKLLVEIARLHHQVELYEQSLAASWPEGAIGDAFDFWNKARNLSPDFLLRDTKKP